MSRRLRNGLNHRQLEAFMAVIEAGSVTAAADLLHVTQPAVTRLVKELEGAVAMPLFERVKGRLVSTREASLFYEAVKRSFLGLDKLLQTAEDIRELRMGTLRIAAMPALALGCLPRVIRRLTRCFPEAKVSLQIRSSEKIMDWVSSQQFDLGFAAIQTPHPAVIQEVLLEASLVAVLPPGHELASRPYLSVRDFAGEAFVSVGPEVGLRQNIDAVFTAAGVDRHLSIDTQLSAAVCGLVLEGAGVALVEPVTASDFRTRGLVVRPFHPRIPFSYSVLFPKLVPRSRLARDFLELVRDELAAEAKADEQQNPGH